ncbi:hypothetical protein AB0451_39520 [Streptomyces sp. NPDC052000]|uniref:hypothetical protein n=1 Tax=Streptomyces sp. NPDC052000 TaxID=3155676 RepID=UPI00344DD3E7
MATPDTSKQARVSADTHRQLMELANQLGGTADDALRHLLDPSTIRVSVTEAQRWRWLVEAKKVGVPVDEFIRLRVEACIQFGADGNALQAIYQRVDALHQRAGLGAPAVNPQSTGPAQAPAPRRQLSTKPTPND